MLAALRTRVLPDAQRRTLAELTDDLDLTAGDSGSKRSAFWTMLTLSAVIASGGVLSDSTATVIGAMIIAPLATPIMGIALSLVKRENLGSLVYVVAGSLWVILLGALFSVFLPAGYDLLGNSEISSRTSPALIDLVIAVATGLAGAVALARRDVSAVLPGVAIAISLVPPLAVVGLCAGQAAWLLSLGALLLFLSNLLAMVIAGSLVFTALGYTAESIAETALETGSGRRRAYVTLAVLFALVAVPLGAHTVVTYALGTWKGRIQEAATTWMSGVPDGSVTRVDSTSTTYYVHVRSPGPPPPVSTLMTALDGTVADGLRIVVISTTGREIQAGRTGD